MHSRVRHQLRFFARSRTSISRRDPNSSCPPILQATGIVEIPVEWIRDDAVYFNMDRMSALRPYTSPEAVFDILRRELEGAHQEGGLFVVTMHPHIIGQRSRIWILEETIRHAQSLGDVWFATHADVARHSAAEAGLQR